MMTETKFYSVEEVSKNNGKNGNRVWIIIKDSVYDVTDYMEEHPGGSELIEEWAGKNATKEFNNAGHSSDAKNELKKHKIGEITQANLGTKKKENLVVEVEDKKSERRSFCSYVSCGLCG